MKTSLGRRAAWGRVRKNQWAEPKEEGGWQRQVTVKGLEEVTERARREHLPQHSKSQGGGRSLVNSEMKDNCRFCQAEQGGETLNKECVRGLWSVNKVNLYLPGGTGSFSLHSKQLGDHG